MRLFGYLLICFSSLFTCLLRVYVVVVLFACLCEFFAYLFIAFVHVLVWRFAYLGWSVV